MQGTFVSDTGTGRQDKRQNQLGYLVRDGVVVRAAFKSGKEGQD